jgi:hypothetical protein
MTFLGIELDTIAMEAILPLDNVLKIKNSLSEMRVRRNVTLRELQSLIGLLSFVCYMYYMCDTAFDGEIH